MMNHLDERNKTQIKDGYDYTQGIDLDYNILSYIAKFDVDDYEISLDKTEIHYGNIRLQKDGFLSLEDYYKKEKKLQYLKEPSI